MELLTAFIGLVTAAFAAWTAYQSRPGRVLQPAAPGYGPPVDPAWGGGSPGGWGPPPDAHPYQGPSYQGPSQQPGGAYHGFGGPIGHPQQPAWDPMAPPHGWAPPPTAPTVSGPTRRYRVATAVRDAGIIFAASATAGFGLGLASPAIADDVALLTAVGLAILLVGFAVAGVVAGPNRWRHLLLTGLFAWAFSLLAVVLGGFEVADVVVWLISLVFYAPIVGLAGAFATLVHRLRSAS